MNYLAHLFLASRDPAMLTGSLLGDFRKYIDQRDKLPTGVLAGMEHHRLVDYFTDNSHLLKELRGLFSPGRRRLAGIILDLCFDYFLSRHWSAFTSEDRPAFIRYCYHCLNDYREVMPERMQTVVEQMIIHDWLGSYADLDSVGISLDRLSARMRFPNQLAGSVVEIKCNLNRLEQGFLDFFPELQRYLLCRRWHPAYLETLHGPVFL
jgi:acyl carrier protein phosphodiesterase